MKINIVLPVLKFFVLCCITTSYSESQILIQGPKNVYRQWQNQSYPKTFQSEAITITNWLYYSQEDWVLTDQNSLQYKQSESSARSRRAQQWISHFLSFEYSQLSFCWVLPKTINTSRLSSQINWMNWLLIICCEPSKCKFKMNSIKI